MTFLPLQMILPLLIRRANLPNSRPSHDGAQTTLELIACILLTVRYSLGVTGEIENYDYSSPAARAFCIFVHAAMFVVAMNGGTACLVVIALDRYWKIVHAVHHRKYYSRWMLYVGLFLPWLNGLATHFIPNVITTRNGNRSCVMPVLKTKVRAYEVRSCIH